MQDRRNVFLVHSVHHPAAKPMHEFLGSLDLRVVTWKHATEAARKEGQSYLSEILDKGFELAHAAVIFMTPDDLTCLDPRLAKDRDPERLQGQPRPNVIFEAGMAWQKFRDRTLLVRFGEVREFTDLSGVSFQSFTGSVKDRSELAGLLKAMGCDLDQTSGSWVDAGTFPTTELPPVTCDDLRLS